MSEKFDVFDEWGRKVGEFIPVSAESGLVGCLVYITLFVLLIIVSIPILLLVKGVQYWRENKKEEAVLCFAGVLLIVTIPFLIYANHNAQQEARIRAREEQKISFRRQVTEAREQIPQTTVISNIRMERPWSRKLTMYFTITNEGRMTIMVAPPVLFYFAGHKPVQTCPLDFNGRGRIEPGSSQECEQSYVMEEGKEQDRLESFCVPIRVVVDYGDSGGIYSYRYVCKELTTP